MMLKPTNIVITFISCALVVVLMLGSCSREDSEAATEPAAEEALTKHHFAEPHLGTVVRIVFYSEDEKKAAQLAKQCFQRVNALNAKLSDYLPESEVSKLSQLPIGQPHKVSDELFTIIAFAQTVSRKTDGAFDITMGKHSKRWRNKDQKPPGTNEPVASYRDLILAPQSKTVTLKKPLMIDLGAIGKGYIADQLMLILRKAGITKAAVIIGGETVLADPPPGKKGWRIGIENPEREVIGKMILSNTCVSTSGDSYQFFEADGKRRSHLIDPATKKSKLNRLNVTTIAPTSMQADAWATALRILPTKKALILANGENELEALFIPFRDEISRTEHFPALKSAKK